MFFFSLHVEGLLLREPRVSEFRVYRVSSKGAPKERPAPLRALGELSGAGGGHARSRAGVPEPIPPSRGRCPLGF